ncbi:DNA/RNA helicase, partial [Pediococcus acidilactici]
MTQTAHNEHPEIEDIQSRGHKNDVGTGVFGKLENIIFFKDKPNDGRKYTKVLGLLDKNREYFWVDT